MPLYAWTEKFSRVFSITGDKIDAQAVSCEMHLTQHFTTGLILLDSPATLAWDCGTGSAMNPEEGGLRHLSVEMRGSQQESAAITAFGSSGFLVDLVDRQD